MRHVGGRFEVNSEVNIEVNSVKQGLNSVEHGHISVEQGLNSVKHGHNAVKTQSNGRAKPQDLNKPAWDPKYGVCSIPLGSPTVVSNWSYVHVPVVPGTVVWYRTLA